jgi:Tetracyclin repressor-like, C-terminal domain
VDGHRDPRECAHRAEALQACDDLESGRQVELEPLAERSGVKRKTWQHWLAELARYYRRALRVNPDLIEFAHSALDPDFAQLEHATRILVGFGFDPRAAGFAHGFVMNLVVGYVHQEARESKQGQSAMARFVQALGSDRGVGRLATLESLALGAADFDPDAAFERFLQYALAGIAAQPGAPA